MDRFGKILISLFVVFSLLYAVLTFSLLLNNYNNLKIITVNSNIMAYPNTEIALDSWIGSLHKYDINKYNCQNFSMTLRKKLKDYNVLFVAGYTKGNKYVIEKISKKNISKIDKDETLKKDGFGAHEWLYIADYNMYIEATNGEIIDWNNISYGQMGE